VQKPIEKQGQLARIIAPNGPPNFMRHIRGEPVSAIAPEVVDIQNVWIDIEPQVNSEAEFLEIASDFGNPLEIVREGISNSIDAGATSIRILFDVQEVDGASTLIIELEDNGAGMCHTTLSKNFWGLGFSKSREDKSKIGEKGHGTKIYLRSEGVYVRSQTQEGACESICERPMRALTKRQAHTPRVRCIPKFQEHTGTFVRVTGYNQNERASFVQDVVKDYIFWFTKFGSVERVFGVEQLVNVQLSLKCLDRQEYEVLAFGHYFPPETPKIDKLFEQHGSNAADLFVRRYKLQSRLKDLPEVTFDAVVSVEGDQVKRLYNPLIRDRRRRDSGKYKVADRYGLWLCKDYIPVQNVNDWISGFGTGSNSFTLLHGFINCQRLKLTANRGSIANTDPKVIEELKKAVQVLLDEINDDLNKDGIYTLFQWQTEERTLAQEKADFDVRTKSFATRRVAILDGRTLLEPRNESELFGLFMSVYALRPDLFEFEPLDYNTTRGIDIVARNKSSNKISESKYWYIELKYVLNETLNHGFKFLRWIVCWDFDKAVKGDSEFGAVQDNDVRRMEIAKGEHEHTVYFLNSKTSAVKIQVIRLREFLRERLALEFKEQ
jgi:Histidine kinase-, DNA gyrase B-, and HSP90-like ATPase